jgi:Domain of unknown function (DUF4132)
MRAGRGAGAVNRWRFRRGEDFPRRADGVKVAGGDTPGPLEPRSLGRAHGSGALPAAAWCAAELDDPVLAPLTRALVWQTGTPGGPVVGLPVRREHTTHWMLRDVRGDVRELADDTPVRLWDPRSADAAEVRAWRKVLARQHLVQPVPQLPAGRA